MRGSKALRLAGDQPERRRGYEGPAVDGGMWLAFRLAMIRIRAIAVAAALASAAAMLPRTASADVAPSAPAVPAPAPTAVAPAASSPPSEIWLGSLQLVLGYGAELGGGYLLASSFTKRDLGIDSDYGLLAMAAMTLPAFAAGAVCGMGYASSYYRGRCWTTFLGAYTGAALGVLAGLTLAGKPGPDDTEAFVQSMTGLAFVVFLSPIGALVGHQIGKVEIPHAAPGAFLLPSEDRRLLVSSGSEARRGAFTEPPAQRLVLPVVSVSW
jgi:hypothetical protein